MKISFLIIVFLLVALVFTVIDLLFYKAFNQLFNNVLSSKAIYKILFWSVPILSFSILVISVYVRSVDVGNIFAVNYIYTALGIVALLLIPKLIGSVFYILDQLVFFISKTNLFINNIGLALSFIMFFAILHGLTINKTNFQVREQEIFSKKIPKEFDGFKVIQISDMHIGSFHKSVSSIQKLVNQINAEQPDVIVFTGDMVSNYSGELDEFIDIFSQLKAKHGMFSILGNHDYGDYVKFESRNDKVENLNNLKMKEAEIGFSMLNNSNTLITVGNSSINIVGVENWGKPPFPQHGDIDLSIEGLDKSLFTILLSHDPSHWRSKVLNYSFIDLTLSGHTHAMQFGFEFGDYQFSPIVLKYKEWAGLYKERNQNLYVNRGTGYIGLPARVGIRPEITKIILRSGK